MDAPIRFVSQLDHQFQGRLRIRWSHQNEWHIEQRMGRGIFEVPSDVARYGDQWVRARDGYSHVLAIKPREWMHCPLCNRPIAVPRFETAEAKCSDCAKQGIDARWRAAFYPLNDKLLTFLHSIDPLRTNVAQEQADAADAANAELQRIAERNTLNTIEAQTHEHWRELAGIQGVGYTGKSL